MSMGGESNAGQASSQAPVLCVVIVLLAAVLTLGDAVSGPTSLRKIAIGLSMICMGLVFLIGPRRPGLASWLKWIGLFLAVGYFVFWVME